MARPTSLVGGGALLGLAEGTALAAPSADTDITPFLA